MTLKDLYDQTSKDQHGNINMVEGGNKVVFFNGTELLVAYLDEQGKLIPADLTTKKAMDIIGGVWRDASNVRFINSIPGIVLNDSAAALKNSELLNTFINKADDIDALIMPRGTLYHAGIVLSKAVDLCGTSKYYSRLKNIGLGIDAITINPNIERGRIYNLSIWGNGIMPFGEDATTNRGIVFNNNSVCWNIDNVWMRGHGGEFLFADGTGNVNNINISNSELEHGKKSAIHFVQCNPSNQINAIYIKNCDISGFGGNGVELWGQSLGVSQCTIQACKNIGIVLDGAISPMASGDLRGCLLDNNYFEQCNYGFILGRAVTRPFPRYLIGLKISNNYGSLNPCIGDVVDKPNISAVEIQAPGWYAYDNFQVTLLSFDNNSISLGGTEYKSVFNGNNVLPATCGVHKSATEFRFMDKFIGLGEARVY